jgi:hypothetical protein
MKLNFIYEITSFSFPIILIYLISIKFYQYSYQSKEIIGNLGVNGNHYANTYLGICLNGLFIFVIVFHFSRLFSVWSYVSGISVVLFLIIIIWHSVSKKKTKENILGIVISILILFAIHFHVYNFYLSKENLDGEEILISVFLTLVGWNIAYHMKYKSLMSRLQSKIVLHSSGNDLNPNHRTTHEYVNIDEYLGNDLISTYPRITLNNHGKIIFDSSDLEIIYDTFLKRGYNPYGIDFSPNRTLEIDNVKYSIEYTSFRLMKYFDDYSIKINNPSMNHDVIKVKDGHLGIGIPYNIHIKIDVNPVIEESPKLKEERPLTEEEKKERANKIAQRLEDLANEISNQKPLTEEEKKKGWEEYYRNKESEE